MRPTRCPSPYVVLPALALALCTGGAARGQTDLRYQFKPGDVLRYVIDKGNEVKVNVQGKTITMSVAEKSHVAWKVLDVAADGTASMTHTVERIQVTMKTPQGVSAYDSAGEGEPTGPGAAELAKGMKPRVGAEFKLKMSPTGRITDVVIPAGVLEAMKNAPGGAKTLSADDLKQMAAQGNLVLPDRAVAQGDSWDSKAQMKMPPLGEIKVKQVFTYAGPADKDGATLQKITVAPEVTLQPQGDAPVQVTLKSSEGEGAAYFDAAAGRLASMSMLQSMVMEVTVMGQTVQQNIQRTTTMQLQR